MVQAGTIDSAKSHDTMLCTRPPSGMTTPRVGVGPPEVMPLVVGAAPAEGQQRVHVRAPRRCVRSLTAAKSGIEPM